MTEALSLSSEEAVVGKIKCVLLCHCQNAGQIHIKRGNIYFKGVTEFWVQNFIHQ